MDFDKGQRVGNTRRQCLADCKSHPTLNIPGIKQMSVHYGSLPPIFCEMPRATGRDKCFSHNRLIVCSMIQPVVITCDTPNAFIPAH